MKTSIEKLADDKLISPEALARLKDAWISNTDELYSRIATCEWSDNPKMKELIAQEIGVQPKDLSDFKTELLPYVSQKAIAEKKPEKHFTGYRV